MWWESASEGAQRRISEFQHVQLVYCD
uniref:Uncharacterized protein n=1 Tax=Anopheles albimanus TaxID=7167 RepID=A0A182FZD6_ANOAL